MTEDTERTQVGRRFWLGWMLTSTASLAVGGWFSSIGLSFGIGALNTGLRESLVVSVLAGVVFAVVGGAVLGASLGIAQYLVLWRKVSRPNWWILASIVAGAASYAIAAVIIVKLGLFRTGTFFSVNLDDAAVLGMLIVIGASIGIAQWLVLRRDVFRSGWWVLASIVGMVVGGELLPATGRTEVYVALALSAVGYGATTGVVMVWMLRQPVTMKPSPPQAAA